ncbi:MAG: hypothetical protein HC886_14920 [Leptolyngbyaceae cyanobacterium SM1_1_3]|nr:hypothetical protein [Leptolyngbyaceae cyanobacterium SM1_1_3]
MPDPRQPLTGRLTACHTLALIGQGYFEATHDCIALLTTQLGKALVHPPQFNAALVEALVKLAAIEATPVIACAFSNQRVQTTVVGDWLTIQLRLGLISYSQWQKKKGAANLLPSRRFHTADMLCKTNDTPSLIRECPYR